MVLLNYYVFFSLVIVKLIKFFGIEGVICYSVVMLIYIYF